MFEHFGIKDIFCGLWRFKYLIIAGTIIGVLGGYFFLSSDNKINEEHKEYYMSETGILEIQLLMHRIIRNQI